VGLRPGSHVRPRWIEWGQPFFFILAQTCLLLPSLAFALAGIAESSSFFHFNDYAKIERGHPSDLCHGPSKWCLGLLRDDYRSFEGVDFTFEEINTPSDQTTPYIIGRRSTDNHWLVYDLKQERLLINDADYDKVIEAWLSLGLTQPIYVDAHNTRELLTETRDSVTSRWRFDLQMWGFYTLTLVTPIGLIFWYLSRKAKGRYRSTGSKVFYIFSYLFLAPVIVVIYVAISSVVQIIIHNW